MYKLTISVVSHGQAGMVRSLLRDFENLYNSGFSCFKLLLTINIPECLGFAPHDFSYPIKYIYNQVPLGYGANHNQAFCSCDTDYFAILNPDIRLYENPFNVLMGTLKKYNAGLVSPAIINPEGLIEDSARYYPTLREVIKKFFGGRSSSYNYKLGDLPFKVDWVGGMFMVLPSPAFAKIKFDKSFYMYYEDVDLCKQLNKSNLSVYLCPLVSAVHIGQRRSRRNIKHAIWHLQSMLRYHLKNFLA